MLVPVTIETCNQKQPLPSPSLSQGAELSWPSCSFGWNPGWGGWEWAQGWVERSELLVYPGLLTGFGICGPHVIPAGFCIKTSLIFFFFFFFSQQPWINEYPSDHRWGFPTQLALPWLQAQPFRPPPTESRAASWQGSREFLEVGVAATKPVSPRASQRARSMPRCFLSALVWTSFRPMGPLRKNDNLGWSDGSVVKVPAALAADVSSVGTQHHPFQGPRW